jgi:Transmembrane secretion effector
MIPKCPLSGGCGWSCRLSKWVGALLDGKKSREAHNGSCQQIHQTGRRDGPRLGVSVCPQIWRRLRGDEDGHRGWHIESGLPAAGPRERMATAQRGAAAGVSTRKRFWINAISNLGIVGALLWWREARRSKTRLPAEPFGQAVLTGLRYARFSPPLLATMSRAAGFSLFASAYWALLPLVAREQIAGGPALYGVLLGVIGASAVGGAFFLSAEAEARSGSADGRGSTSITVVILCWHICLISESMGHHDSEIMDDRSID